MTDADNAPHLADTTRILGYAGLLPQIGAVALLVVPGWDRQLGALLAFAYGGLILSFLGGIWWGFAMRRETGQGALATLAVTPSLVALGLFLAVLGNLPFGWTLVALGGAILLTLPVDRHLAATGDAPADWMRLRLPLSAGLGTLTIVAGVLTGR